MGRSFPLFQHVVEETAKAPDRVRIENLFDDAGGESSARPRSERVNELNFSEIWLWDRKTTVQDRSGSTILSSTGV